MTITSRSKKAKKILKDLHKKNGDDPDLKKGKENFKCYEKKKADK